ncbi:50S ribosomal protein L1 [Candidatus Saccharibacteria bacterium]|nr:50S ribosomal protein L1 [Candidatus Saccharibacteria bacterium]
MAEVKKANKREQATKQKTPEPATDTKSVAKNGSENKVEVLQTEEVMKDNPPIPKATAKAGKRSAKAVKETEDKLAKETRKTGKEENPKKFKQPSRSRVERAGKKFKIASELIDKTKTYTLTEAIDLAIKTTTTNFDSTIELHVSLGVDPKQADQNIREIVVLPAGTGKTLRIVAFVEGDDEQKAIKAGADLAGADKIQAKLEKEDIDFDILVATPAMMPRLSKYARFLGPRGLMPNPKSGTVTTDVEKAVKQAKAGRVEYRVDSAGIVHMGIGKTSFGSDKLVQNAQAALSSIKSAKPSSLKGNYFKTVYITSTMGPSIRTENP